MESIINFIGDNFRFIWVIGMFREIEEHHVVLAVFGEHKSISVALSELQVREKFLNIGSREKHSV